MATKYYTHFVTAGAKPKRAPDSSEWSGVVELRHPLEQSGGTQELKACSHRVSIWTQRTSRFSTGPGCTESPSGLPSLHRKSAFSPPVRKGLGLFVYWRKSPAAILRTKPLLPPAKGVTFAG